TPVATRDRCSEPGERPRGCCFQRPTVPSPLAPGRSQVLSLSEWNPSVGSLRLCRGESWHHLAPETGSQGTKRREKRDLVQVDDNAISLVAQRLPAVSPGGNVHAVGYVLEDRP